MDAHLGRLTALAPPSRVNRVRRKLLRRVLAAASRAPGLYQLVMPTGSGKTLAAMAMALRHADRYGHCRVIYAAPFTSIIDQTAEVYRNVGLQPLEHHSALDPDQQSYGSRLATENWDAPVIATTAVQLLESLHAAKTSRLRKLHNIAGSVIILDEAQTVPLKLWEQTWLTLCSLVEHYGCTVIAMSATPIDLSDAADILPRQEQAATALERVTVEEMTLPGSAALAAHLRNERQALCIMDTRNGALDVAALVPDSIYLSTYMCAAHRAKVIAGIRERLARNEPVIVVSTQLIEAGVDVDFPVVYRQVGGVDRVAQAAGRCNREGRLHRGRMVIVRLPEAPPRGLLRTGKGVSDQMAVDGQNWLSPSVARDYHRRMQRRINLGGALVQHSRKLALRTVSELYQLVDDDQVAMVVPYAEGEQLIAELRASGATKGLLRRMQRYTVAVPVYLARHLLMEEVDGVPVFLGQYGSKGIDVVAAQAVLIA
jgi:CRISPR-associated endonuclease/helicase Cas3